MRVVVIGGSAGSIEALRTLLREVPAGLDAAFVVVIHISPSQPSLLVPILTSFTDMPVREALDKAPLPAGSVTIAPPDYHTLIEDCDPPTIALSRDGEVHFSRPAIDALFETAAHTCGARAVGVLLTGGNEDGARGLGLIQQKGGRVAVQDPSSAVSPEMPMAGLATCTPDLVGNPSALGGWLATLLAPAEAS
jgi:two-component system, chemotaxis family, protein-glutamate methylesterase/glutaminase